MITCPTCGGSTQTGYVCPQCHGRQVVEGDDPLDDIDEVVHLDPHGCCYERCSTYCSGFEGHDYQPCRGAPCDYCDRATLEYVRHLWRSYCSRVRRALDSHPPYLANLILDTAELHGRLGCEWPRALCDRCDQPLPQGRTHRVYRMGSELYECPPVPERQ